MLFSSLLLEEYVPIIKYIKGPDNDMEYDLERITLIKYDATENNITGETLTDSYCVDKLYGGMLPLTCQMINNININAKNW